MDAENTPTGHERAGSTALGGAVPPAGPGPATPLAVRPTPATSPPSCSIVAKSTWSPYRWHEQPTWGEAMDKETGPQILVAFASIVRRVRALENTAASAGDGPAAVVSV